MNSVMTNKTNIGTMTYPFLVKFETWAIESTSIKKEEELETLLDDKRQPTVMWVGDGKAYRLFIPGVSEKAFWQQTGLAPSMEKGGFTLSKRLKRILSPERFCRFMPKQELTIFHDDTLNSALWDGCGLISKAFVTRFVDALDLSQRAERELLKSGRFEVTLMHEGGQEKGHVIVRDDIDYDFVFPAGSAKPELRLTGEDCFVALNPIHKHDSMLLDIQSLINLHPFFSVSQLSQWHREWLMTFVASIRSGRQMDVAMKRLAHIESVEELDKACRWHVLDYLSSGGHPMWFAGIVRALGKQVSKMLGHKLEKFRFPIPGGRYYIMPADVGQKNVPSGQVELDPKHATAWVNGADWLTYIVDVLGGCDGDDALWCHPFTDKQDGERKVLLWRSPNQLGEYVLLNPTANCQSLIWETCDELRHEWVLGDSSKLPPRIDEIEMAYGQLPVETGFPDLTYAVDAMWPTVMQGHQNANTLGGFCNLLMVIKAVYGRLPNTMPASMEAVIDGMVKEGRDLSPVKRWLRESALCMAQQRTAVPETLINRLLPLLGSDQSARGMIRLAKNHWLDVLIKSAQRELDHFEAEIDTVAHEACPPVELFQAYGEWMAAGQALKSAYALALRKAPKMENGSLMEVAYANAAHVTWSELNRWPVEKRPFVLIGTALYCYGNGFNKSEQLYAGDQVVWQLGQRESETTVRGRGIAQAFIDALRQIGLLCEPVWSDEGVYCQTRITDTSKLGIPVRLNGVWINYLNSIMKARKQPAYTAMSQVAPTLMIETKAQIATMVKNQFQDMALMVTIEGEGQAARTVAYTKHGNLFGKVGKSYQVQPGHYTLVWSTAVDGNIYGILQKEDSTDSKRDSKREVMVN